MEKCLKEGVKEMEIAVSAFLSESSDVHIFCFENEAEINDFVSALDVNGLPVEAVQLSQTYADIKRYVGNSLEKKGFPDRCIRNADTAFLNIVQGVCKDIDKFFK